MLAILAVLFASSGALAADPAAAPWPQQADPSKLPDGPWKEAVLYGRRLIVETPSLVGPEVADKSMRYAGNNLSCQSCHLQAGTQQFALPLVAAFGAYPAYMG